MKKPLLIGVVVLVIIGAILALVMIQRPMTDEEILRDAILDAGSATCTIVDPDTEESFEVMFKDGRTKMSGSSQGFEFFLVAGEENVYIWDTMSREGIFFPIANSLEMGVHRFDDREMLFEDIKLQATDCSAETISDDLFERPEEISFYTQEEFLTRQLEGIDMEDLEESENPNSEIEE